MAKRGLPPSSRKPRPKTFRRKKGTSTASSILKFGVAIVAIAGMGYCISETSGVAYGEDDIVVVDFSSLTSGEKRIALREANGARCTCGCGMTLAQCVSTDSTCPIREPNIQRIKDIVQKANRP
jgi:hypothetical protein